MPEYKLIPIEQLIEPEIAARAAMDADKLRELADSVNEIGFIHPLAVVPAAAVAEVQKPRGKSGPKPKPSEAHFRYEIADGHRRYKVGVMLRMKALPCLVFADVETAKQAVKLHANLYREDLSAAEEAAFLGDLIEKYDYTEEQLSKSVRQSVSWINTRLDLLRGNKDVLQALADRKINLGVARQLNTVKDESQTKYFLTLAIEGGATMNMVARWIAEWKKQVDAAANPAPPPPAAGNGAAEAVPLPACILCRQTHNPFHFLPVMAHDYCLTNLNTQIDAAAAGDMRPGAPTNL